MKREWLLSAVLVVLAGCATATPDWQADDQPVLTRRFLSLRQIYAGMSQAEVQGVLGAEVVIGYEVRDPKSGQYHPVTLKNPYRSDELQSEGKDYSVDYYFVGINKADGKVTDDELVPLIFSSKTLVAQGWDALGAMSSKSE